ncbi:hypothetical protein L1987_09334 [Smallanthus sonchifolius]|uniref:Uncharacterized protein n=1 Tax=Smallanthus sonchifolius TaxID=185202 RepID=A0ACB9JNM5_9ASTR|nr:hypothetical protein L1987_09334 [Smallanthus sonchifolius]
MNHPSTVIQIAQLPVPPPGPPPLNLPRIDLLQGSREDYVKVGIPLYEAAIKGDWKAAKPILDMQPDLMRFAITENYETLLHIAAAAQSTNAVEEFVTNLVQLMEKEDLELQNKNFDTALGLAAAAGNVETARIMVKKNPVLIEIPGNRKIMPLYMAALYAKPDMVRYLYDNSKKMTGDFWDDENQGWVLQKCIEADIFVTISSFVEKGLVTNVLLALAHKNHAFEGIKPHVVFRIIKSKMAKQKDTKNVSGAALEMQRELLWFKEVEQMVPPMYRKRKNEKGETPKDLFVKKHVALVSKGEDWMNNYMLVATLIATIVFAAAFTLPGGYNQNTGIPLFRNEPSLIIFVISDAVSLISSSTSVLIFLSILTSRYVEHDFMESLSEKLMFGIATLFLSIMTMMVAFSASFFVLYDKKLKWVPIVVTCLAGMPVILFAKLQFRFLVDVFSFTYRSRYLFKPKQRILYY